MAAISEPLLPPFQESKCCFSTRCPDKAKIIQPHGQSAYFVIYIGERIVEIADVRRQHNTILLERFFDPFEAAKDENIWIEIDHLGDARIPSVKVLNVEWLHRGVELDNVIIVCHRIEAFDSDIFNR